MGFRAYRLAVRRALPGAPGRRAVALRRRGTRPQGCARATPSRSAASLTADATAGATSRLKTEGTMCSGCSPASTTRSAMARAAASFMPSMTREAPLSRSPRKNPGKHKTLLI